MRSADLVPTVATVLDSIETGTSKDLNYENDNGTTGFTAQARSQGDRRELYLKLCLLFSRLPSQAEGSKSL